MSRLKAMWTMRESFENGGEFFLVLSGVTTLRL
jgi:hypothetical protein